MATANTVDKEDDLVIVEVDPSKQQTGAVEHDNDVDKDEDHDADEGVGDERGRVSGDDENLTDEEVKAKQDRRRQERADRKMRQDEAKERARRDRAELRYLREHTSQLEARLTNTERNQQTFATGHLEGQINDAQQRYQMASDVIAKAIAAGNGADATEAMRLRDQAQQHLWVLNAQKQQAGQQAQQRPQGNKPDPEIVTRAREFANKHKAWYKPGGDNEDSEIVNAIDRALTREGFDARDDEYWEQLEQRAAKRLPERFEKPSTERTPRGGPALASGRQASNGNAGGGKEFYLSAERKDAIIQAGAWDDATARNKMIKAYAEYDKQQKSR